MNWTTASQQNKHTISCSLCMREREREREMSHGASSKGSLHSERGMWDPSLGGASSFCYGKKIASCRREGGAQFNGGLELLELCVGLLHSMV